MSKGTKQLAAVTIGLSFFAIVSTLAVLDHQGAAKQNEHGQSFGDAMQTMINLSSTPRIDTEKAFANILQAGDLEILFEGKPVRSMEVSSYMVGDPTLTQERPIKVKWGHRITILTGEIGPWIGESARIGEWVYTYEVNEEGDILKGYRAHISDDP